MNQMKTCGGGKQQPYIAKGNGPISGQYTDKERTTYKNIKGSYNIAKSMLVKEVNEIYVYSTNKMPTIGKPNSCAKMVMHNNLLQERFYDEYGIVYLDIDYSNHGNPYTHSCVPHQHKWILKNKQLIRQEGEKINDKK